MLVSLLEEYQSDISKEENGQLDYLGWAGLMCERICPALLFRTEIRVERIAHGAYFVDKTLFFLLLWADCSFEA